MKYECYGYGTEDVMIYEVDEENGLERCLTWNPNSPADFKGAWFPIAGSCKGCKYITKEEAFLIML